MTNQSNDEENTEETRSGLSALDGITDLVTGASIPTSVRRNLWKALSRLSSAVIDIPVAYLEGKADELRAQTAARINLTQTTSSQIAQQMNTDPEYARRAVKQFGQKVLREQVNLDMISIKAVDELNAFGDSRIKLDSDEAISDDWLNNFDSEARKISTDEMQTYFGRMLAGEIIKPNSFSAKSVRMLGDLDQCSAQTFVKLCSACVIRELFQGDPMDMRVSSLGGNPGNNALSKYGLSFEELNFLNEYGFIISDYNSWINYQICIGITTPVTDGKTHKIRFPFFHQGKTWILDPTSEYNPKEDFKLYGVSLTRSGRELQNIVKQIPMNDYTNDLIEFFRRNDLLMTAVSGA